MSEPNGICDDDDAQDFIDQLVDLVYRGQKEFTGDSEGLLRSCGVEPEAGWHSIAQCWTVSSFLGDKDAWEYLNGHVSQERLEDLEAGAVPSAEELLVARKRCEEYVLGSSDAGLRIELYQITHRDGRAIYFTSAHGDDGELVYCEGPFRTRADAEVVEERSTGSGGYSFTVSNGWTEL